MRNKFSKSFVIRLYMNYLKIESIPLLVTEVTIVAFVGQVIVHYCDRLVYRSFQCQIKET
jgi:hypothetical protein